MMDGEDEKGKNKEIDKKIHTYIRSYSTTKTVKHTKQGYREGIFDTEEARLKVAKT
jgi:hypothetical protein